MRQITFLLLALLAPLTASATPPQDKYLAHHCALTPSVTPADHYPGRDAFVPSNKLALPAGKAVYPNGQLVFLSGRVFDENCVPISDAIIEIWQTDPLGHYIQSSLSERLSPYPAFAGSGRATTDNLGRYNFVTLFPGAYERSAPHIHFHIFRQDFSTLDTQLFFQDDRRNIDDSKYAHLPPGQRPLVLAKLSPYTTPTGENGLSAQWDITLHGNNWHRF